MSDERSTERLEDRIAEVRSGVRRIEDHLAERERFWNRARERAFLVGAMILVAVGAVVVSDRRKP
jgi:hypothetical protein